MAGNHLFQGGTHVLLPNLSQDVAGHIASLATAIPQLPPLPVILQHLQRYKVSGTPSDTLAQTP